MSAAVEELRPLTAGRLLTIRQTAAEQTEDELARALLCNAQVLAESCFQGGRPVFADGQAVLDALTCREMETLLELLAAGEQPAPAAPVNPRFDAGRFARLREEQG
jgi:hypothetical protein